MESNITNHNPLGPGCFVIVTHGMSGYFAVWIHINRVDHAPDEFPEPWETGQGRYPIGHERTATTIHPPAMSPDPL